MRIAIDYDGTYTADRELWDRFIRDAKERGHSVLIVTSRRDTEENREEVQTNGWPVIFTDMAAKKHHMDARGVWIDVWIDDEPEYIIHGR